jgi:hypothetical protein
MVLPVTAPLPSAALRLILPSSVPARWVARLRLLDALRVAVLLTLVLLSPCSWEEVPVALLPALLRGLLDALTGGAGGAGGAAGGAAAAGTKTPKGTTEKGVAAAAGTGATSGLPTTADDGTITMTFHQVNQDGAGPLTAQIDATSGGTDPAAFQDATVTQNVPGIGIGGLSAASVMDFPVKVQMPAGMTCQGTAGGASNVCIVRMQNSALAGPFGGSAAFTQSTAAKKRAVEYNLRKRHMARGILGKPE